MPSCILVVLVVCAVAGAHVPGQPRQQTWPQGEYRALNQTS